jgi:nicotinamidase-related amidase
MRLERHSTVLLVIDVQEKLMPAIDGRDEVERNIDRLVRGAAILGIPALLTEQYAKGLGPTVEIVRRAFEETTGYRPIEKMCFSASGCDAFSTQIEALGRKQVLVAGVEAHVCVYQSIKDLIKHGCDVSVMADAVSSRTPRNREIALQRMMTDGVRLSSTEMALFELLAVSGTDEFRAISQLVK